MTGYNHKEAVEAAKKELAIKNNQVEAENETITSSSNEEEDEVKEIKDTVVLSNGEIVQFNFNYLTGKTILNLKSEFKRNQKTMIMMEELDDAYCTFVAGKISNKTYEEIIELKYQDWLKIKNFVKDFLLGA